MKLNFGTQDPASAGGFVDKAGRCHLEVESVDESKADYTTVSCKVIAHDEKDQIGKTVNVRLDSAGKFVRKSRDFLIAVGLVDMDRFINGGKEGQTSFTFDMQECIGRTFLTTIEESKSKDDPKKKFYNTSFKMYRIDDVTALSDKWPMAKVEEEVNF